MGCGMGTGYYAGGDQSLNKWSSLIETSVKLKTAIAEPTVQTDAKLAVASDVFKITLEGNGLYDDAAGNRSPHNPIKAGDIIYFEEASKPAATVLQNEAMLVKSVDTNDQTLIVERGFLGTTPDEITATPTKVIYVRKCDGGAFPKATAPPILKRTVARGTHATDDEVLGNIQTSGTRRPRSHNRDITPGTTTAAVATHLPPQANSKGQMWDNPIEGGNYNYGFDMDFRLYSVLGPFMRPAVIRDVVDSGKIPTVKTSQFPGVLTIADPYNSANYLPRSSNVPADHGYKLKAKVSSLSAAGLALDVANDRMNEKGCTLINPCIISVAADAGTKGEQMYEVTAVSNNGLTLTVVRPSATTFGMPPAAPFGNTGTDANGGQVKSGDIVTYYPGWKKIAALPTAATATATALSLSAANDELENLALPFYLKIGAEFLKVI
jgi:hypothetical protein